MTEATAARTSETSRLTMFFGTVLIIMFVCTVLLDVAGIVQYFSAAKEASLTMEICSSVTMGLAVPFLAMGMSISADTHRRNRLEHTASG